MSSSERNGGRRRRAIDRRLRRTRERLVRETPVVRHAVARQLSGLQRPGRLAALLVLVFGGGLAGAVLVGRGEAAGSDAHAYWAAVRIWLGGGNPYHPEGPFLPYVYPPWMLPFFAPWALLPWGVAWVVWRGTTLILLGWTVQWAYARRPIATAVVALIVGVPVVANLDTGNITLLLALALWGAQFTGPHRSGLFWAVATWMKWVPAPLLFVLAPRARLWGIGWLAACAVLSLLTLPLTVVQLQALFGFGPRPIRLDYLALIWAIVPWWWRHPNPLWWALPSEWPTLAGRATWTLRRAWFTARTDPRGAADRSRGAVVTWVREFLGLRPSAPRPAAPGTGPAGSA